MILQEVNMIIVSTWQKCVVVICYIFFYYLMIACSRKHNGWGEKGEDDLKGVFEMKNFGAEKKILNIEIIFLS